MASLFSSFLFRQSLFFSLVMFLYLCLVFSSLKHILLYVLLLLFHYFPLIILLVFSEVLSSVLDVSSLTLEMSWPLFLSIYSVLFLFPKCQSCKH